MASQIAIIPVVVIGLILAILEIVFVHKDEAGMGWPKHALHAIPTMFIFIFISMNIDYVVVDLLKLQLQTWMTIGIRVLIGVIAAAKISAAAAVAGKVGEKLPHTLVIAALVMVSPFIWDLVLCNIAFIKTLPLSGCKA